MLLLISFISVMLSPPGTPGGVPEVGGTIMVQGAFSLLLLSVLSCPFQQLVVEAISADRAVGVHGSQADSPPPVAHSPIPIYVPVLCEIHTSLSDPLFPFAAGFVAQRSSSLCGPQTLPASSGISVCVTAIECIFIEIGI